VGTLAPMMAILLQKIAATWHKQLCTHESFCLQVHFNGSSVEDDDDDEEEEEEEEEEDDEDDDDDKNTF